MVADMAAAKEVVKEAAKEAVTEAAKEAVTEEAKEEDKEADKEEAKVICERLHIELLHIFEGGYI